MHGIFIGTRIIHSIFSILTSTKKWIGTEKAYSIHSKDDAYTSEQVNCSKKLAYAIVRYTQRNTSLEAEIVGIVERKEPTVAYKTASLSFVLTFVFYCQPNVILEVYEQTFHCFWISISFSLKSPLWSLGNL